MGYSYEVETESGERLTVDQPSLDQAVVSQMLAEGLDDDGKVTLYAGAQYLVLDRLGETLAWESHKRAYGFPDDPLVERVVKGLAFLADIALSALEDDKGVDEFLRILLAEGKDPFQAFADSNKDPVTSS